MIIQNKIILPQFAYTEHIHKKTEVLLTLSLYQTSIAEIYGWECDAQKSIWKGQKEGDEWTAEDTNEYLQSFVQ